METRIPITVKPSCKHCGSDDLSIPDVDRPDDPVSCRACGAQHGTRAMFDEELAQQAGNFLADKFEDAIRSALDGMPNVTFKKG